MWYRYNRGTDSTGDFADLPANRPHLYLIRNNRFPPTHKRNRLNSELAFRAEEISDDSGRGSCKSSGGRCASDRRECHYLDQTPLCAQTKTNLSFWMMPESLTYGNGCVWRPSANTSKRTSYKPFTLSTLERSELIRSWRVINLDTKAKFGTPHKGHCVRSDNWTTGFLLKLL